MTAVFAIGLYAFSMSITPGPTNVILLSTGVRYGFLKAVPFASGGAIGFSILNFIIAVGLGEFAQGNDIFLNFLSYGGAAFICYMGYKIATAPTQLEEVGDNENADAGPPGFVSGMIVQWLSPKSWIASIAGVGAFVTAGDFQQVIVYVTIYITVGFCSILPWAYAGSKISRFLGDTRNMRIFNLTMGGGLILIAGYLITV